MPKRRVKPYHRRWHGDALNGYQPLSLEERGAYTTLLDQMYDHGGPIRDDDRAICYWLNCDIRVWRRLRQALVAHHRKLLALTDDHGVRWLVNDRVQRELGLDTYADLSASQAPKFARATAQLSPKSSEKLSENSDHTAENAPLVRARSSTSTSTSNSTTPPKPPRGQESEDSGNQEDTPPGKPKRRPRRTAGQTVLTTIPDGFPTQDLIRKWQEQARADGRNIDIAHQAKLYEAHRRKKGEPQADWEADLAGWMLRKIDEAPKYPTVPGTVDESEKARQSRRRIQNWMTRPHSWEEFDWGPQPHDPACRVPAPILAEFEIGLWRDRVIRWQGNPYGWDEANWGPPPNKPGCKAPVAILHQCGIPAPASVLAEPMRGAA